MSRTPSRTLEPDPTAALDAGLGAVLDAPQDAGRDLVDALDRLARDGDVAEAHRRADRAAADPAQHVALMGFDLCEVAGRRGARRLLRRVREEERAPGTHGLRRPAWAPVQAWAHFRLWRHGRALTLAEEHLVRDDGAGPMEAPSPEAAGLWCAVLDAIRRSALRQGYLRVAQRAHHLADAAAPRAGALAPARPRATEEMAAVATLVEDHPRHGLPPSLARYLARSLGHREGDSISGAAEVARDLHLTPADLDAALDLARRHGFEDRVAQRLTTFSERLFQGDWQGRRRLQRILVLVFWAVVALGLILGLTLLQHAL